MTDRAKVAEFISFCIETFAGEKGVSGARVAAVFQACGLIDFLDSGYDLLHTQGERWLLSEMEEYLKKRGVSV